MLVCTEWLPRESGTCFKWRISACKYLRGHVRHTSAGESAPARSKNLQRLCRWNALSDLRVGLRRVRVETDK
ncbi:uncharacterized protein DS421_17g580460 [Arachis hypogaea]|nr:uncharacterized protein DS421_17g580460 [Arachis hypogaea]